ncbi:MAG: 3-deoxy-8-phosphooctulonate synthase [Kiritimatiellia bacterium]|nr:3-deoxy-8-phosphooctulonate synthase [Kiritimatiellia bacterium]MDP6630710.1 3-deoxy-8-phosphooctulonate synthase [Kiritimatiellia bacterium]MDP6809427.1 3-deoxy-8-phosphooctulonate synthase [Kiritimatiellia bacterium]MDP7023896.1 3-deoxy-8-phosphooctulonate synthase [Kiritimatiellia bacterium]
MKVKTVSVGGVKVGGRHPLVLIAGPCVIERREACLDVARRLVRLSKREQIPFIFKASYDKANRSSVRAFRGPGIEEGLAILAEVKEALDVPVLTDVHSVAEVAAAARVVDVIQIPAFLARQTDLLVAAGRTRKVVNVKKGQFMSPEEMANAIAKVESGGGRRIMLTERGTSFGYNNLVADMRSLPIMRGLGYPVIFDATHSVQRPGGGGDRSIGDREWAPLLARAAVATGCDAVFIETYVDPDKALCDGANALVLKDLKSIWRQLRAVDGVVND